MTTAPPLHRQRGSSVTHVCRTRSLQMEPDDPGRGGWGAGGGRGATDFAFHDVSRSRVETGHRGARAPDTCTLCKSGVTPPHPAEPAPRHTRVFSDWTQFGSTCSHGKKSSRKKGPVETMFLFSEVISEEENFLEKFMESLN